MKKILISLSLIVPFISFAAVEYDMRKGVDLTATNYVTGSLLNNLVDTGTISATNKGAIIRRSGGGGSWWPDVTSNPRYTNFVWLDMNTSPSTLKSYVCCGDVYSNWVVSTITPGSVTSAEIKDYTIAAIDMGTNSVPNYAIQDNAVDANKIQAQAVVAGKIGPSAVSNLNIAPSTIEGGRIALNTISNANIYDFTITSNKIAINGIADFNIKAGGMIGSNVIAPFSLTGTNLQNSTITNEQLAPLAVDSNKIASATVGMEKLATNVSPSLIKAWAIVDAAGTVLKAHNISSATRFNAGDFRVVFGSGFAPANTNYIVWGSAINAIGSAGAVFTVYSNETISCAYNIQNTAGGDLDTTAYIIFLSFP